MKLKTFMLGDMKMSQDEKMFILFVVGWLVGLFLGIGIGLNLTLG